MNKRSSSLAPLAETVTIVVPTKNERANLGGFLASIPPEIAVLLVDASDDGTPDLALRLRPARTRVVRDLGNIAHARQLGAELAETEWVLFTDADVAFAPGYFEALAATRLSAGTGALFGRKTALGSYPVYHALFTGGQKLCAAFGIAAASGSNMLVRRDALREAGGFDLELSCNEDSEVLWRVADAGYEVRFAPELCVQSRDDRRLQRGSARKLAHSALRCILLYTEVLPRRWRAHDWGYWSG
jgi:glycosyltransferase involved in cell wall biosynthesis